MSGSKNPKILLDRIAEFMAQENEEISDEELLEETGAATEAELVEVQNLQRRLEEKSAQARRERLIAARAEYEATIAARKNRAASPRPPMSEMKRRIEEVFTNCGERPVALAFRNGDVQSDNDLISLWDRLCELGLVVNRDKQ
jgi:hypothetical protein